jgi:hypothetical protein
MDYYVASNLHVESVSDMILTMKHRHSSD